MSWRGDAHVVADLGLHIRYLAELVGHEISPKQHLCHAFSGAMQLAPHMLPL